MDYHHILRFAKKVAKETVAAAKARFARACGRSIAFKALHEGKNPRRLVIHAVPSGEPGVYHELAVSFVTPDGKNIADLLIGLDANGECRVLSTADGDGDGDKRVALFPERKAESVATPWE